MSLRALLLIHAAITLAAAIVLVAAPPLIPSTVGIALSSDAYLLCYLLGAAELAVAYLSFAGSRIAEPNALRLIVSTIVVFHLATAAVELYAFTRGVSGRILANVALRVIIVLLFTYHSRSKHIDD